MVPAMPASPMESSDLGQSSAINVTVTSPKAGVVLVQLNLHTPGAAAALASST